MDKTVEELLVGLDELQAELEMLQAENLRLRENNARLVEYIRENLASREREHPVMVLVGLCRFIIKQFI